MLSGVRRPKWDRRSLAVWKQVAGRGGEHLKMTSELWPVSCRASMWCCLFKAARKWSTGTWQGQRDSSKSEQIWGGLVNFSRYLYRNHLTQSWNTQICLDLRNHARVYRKQLMFDTTFCPSISRSNPAPFWAERLVQLIKRLGRENAGYWHHNL